MPKKNPANLRMVAFIDNSTPIFNTLVVDTPTSRLPTFEPHETHDEFLRRHEFGDWLYYVSFASKS